MTVIVDTAPVVALADRNDRNRSLVSRFLHSAREPLVVPAPVTAEIEYFLSRRISNLARRNFLLDIARGRFRVECLTQDEYRLVLALSERYSDLNPGLADLSIVVMAHRFDTVRVLTFDERHFRSIEPIKGGTFDLVPGLDRSA